MKLNIVFRCMPRRFLLLLWVLAVAVFSSCGYAKDAEEGVDAASFGRRLAECKTVLHRMIPGEDLVEDLYLGWMLEPYRRATLAVSVKTVAVLEREMKLREQGRDAIEDQHVEQMFSWLEKVLHGDFNPRQPGFAPHDIRMGKGALERMLVKRMPGEVPRCLYAFADRATFTQAKRWFGDFDLLASAGFRVYPVGRNRRLSATDIEALEKHSEALGIGLLDARLPLAAKRELPYDLQVRIQAMSLGELLDGKLRSGGTDDVEFVPAIFDPADGETWAGMLARSALYRGATGNGFVIRMGCIAPSGIEKSANDRVRAGMWVNALEGQRLGIVEGWRDLRDGTRTMYRSEFTDPARLETVCHTALDLLCASKVLGYFNKPPRLCLLVGEKQLAAGLDNDWSTGLLAVVDGLIARQAGFDLAPDKSDISAVKDCNGKPYDLAVCVSGLPPQPEDSVRFQYSYSIAGQSTKQRTSVTGGNRSLEDSVAADIAELLRLSKSGSSSFKVTSAGGELEPGLYVRPTDDGEGVAVVNLLGINRSLIVERAGDKGERMLTLVDYLGGEKVKIGSEVALRAYQVRILLPESHFAK